MKSKQTHQECVSLATINFSDLCSTKTKMGTFRYDTLSEINSLELSITMMAASKIAPILRKIALTKLVQILWEINMLSQQYRFSFVSGSNLLWNIIKTSYLSVRIIEVLDKRGLDIRGCTIYRTADYFRWVLNFVTFVSELTCRK